MKDSYTQDLAKRLRDLRGGKIANLIPQQIDAMLTDTANAIELQATDLGLERESHEITKRMLEDAQGGPNVEALQRQVEAARDVITLGVELMTTEQVGQWTGVRAWLELDTTAYATNSPTKGA